jgi:hypothetical protein
VFNTHYACPMGPRSASRRNLACQRGVVDVELGK